MRAVLAAALLFSGGAVPGATFGGTGVQGASVNYVALPHPGGASIQVVRRDTGEVDRWRNFDRSYGVPVAAYDGSSTTGLSDDERTLVLSEVSNDYPPRRSRMVVLNPFDLRPRMTLNLPGVYTVHALSPDGRFIYLIRYTAPIRDIDHHELTVYDLENQGAPEAIEHAVGTPLSRVEDGDLVYTLYGPNEPFIRALDTVNRKVKRIPLRGLVPADVTSMRLKLDGERLLVQQIEWTKIDGGVNAREERHTVRSIPLAARPAPKEQEDYGWALLALPVAALAASALAMRRRT
jgi:hypothetical protein